VGSPHRFIVIMVWSDNFFLCNYEILEKNEKGEKNHRLRIGSGDVFIEVEILPLS
jgi:hypothetical protein